MSSTDRSPTALYRELNQQYFGGRLPQYRVTFTQLPAWGHHGHCDAARRLIQIQRGVSGAVLRQSLLHEMCHIGSPYHDRRWQAKLARIAEQGEAGAREELEAYQNTRLTWNQMVADLKDGLEGQASKQPRPSFATIRRIAAYELMCRPDEVLRKAPWLPAAWRNACVKVDHRKALRAEWEAG